MSERDWIPVDRELPAEGEVVEAMAPSGMVQDLKRDGRLWFFPDGSMYVYYHVKFWRPKQREQP